ncbi:MAG: magnesium-translocating P-type ATPase [Bacteroidia bacterium]
MKTDGPFWNMSPSELFQELDSGIEGITEEQALKRKKAVVKKWQSARFKDLILFLRQFKNPLVLLLVVALLLSLSAGTYIDCVIIFSILFFSALLGFIQERNANNAVEKLRSLIQTKTCVKRNGKTSEIPIGDVVPGDIIILKAGDIAPADSLIVESKDLYINESVLTGESFPSEKKSGTLPENTPLINRKNSVFKGTSAISGTAILIAVSTGEQTLLGKIETEIGVISEETAFEKGIKHFGYMLMRVALLMSGIIIIVNISLGRPAIDSILFAFALSVGLAPELLPAIVTITLSAGAKQLASKKVIVKKLSAIQNLGSVDILCCDKTGTLTDGEVKIHSYVSVDGKPHELIGKYAYLNAYFESGYSNPMDDTIRKQLKTDISGYSKYDEVPYDFIRKRLSIVVANGEKHTMITKGALKNVVEVCDAIHLGNDAIVPLEQYREDLKEQLDQFSAKGFRTIGVCYKDVTTDPVISKEDESNMIFLGFILLNDPPKLNISQILEELKTKKVEIKIITGDNTLIAKNIASQIGIPFHRIISGQELHLLSDDALAAKVDEIDIFSETEPSQKEQIVRALQLKGHVVGYLGDGINDASALKIADVGISVNNAVDVAKESADIILLEKDLGVISEGITEGRRTYLNTMKYIFISICANFGNMFSLAIVSVLLPYLPLLPAQILLINFLSDLPAFSIVSDNVDEELLEKPRKWDIKLIRKFMIVFGLESSVFDFITFGALLFIFSSPIAEFRTGWFIESVISEILILLIIRTRRTFIASRPGKTLTISSILVATVVLIIPYIKTFAPMGFTSLPFNVILSMCIISLIYAFVGEMTKKIIFKKMNY